MLSFTCPWLCGCPLPKSSCQKRMNKQRQLRSSAIKSSAASPFPTRELDNLLKWCHQQGICLNNTTILQQGSSRGLYATKDIHPGDLLLSIPRHAAIVTNTQSGSVPPLRVLKGLSVDYWKGIPWEIQLTIRLLDLCLDTHSSFRPYIDSLPSNPNSVLFAYENLGRSLVAGQLRPYRLHNIADLSRASAKSRFNAFKRALSHSCRDLVTLRAFCWALSIAVSRGFGIPATGLAKSHLHPIHPTPVTPQPVEYALFPALDMTNCSVYCQTKFVHDRDNDLFLVYTGARFSRGEQVYVSYGSKSNDDFVFFYGFVEGHNPANTVSIPEFRKWILDLAHRVDVNPADWDRKLQLLLREKLTHPEKTYEFRLDRLDEDLMYVLRVALASSEELHIAEREAGNETLKMSTTFSLRNELDVWQAIAEKCESLVQELGGFDAKELERLELLLSMKPCTAEWQWGDVGSDGELIYRHERYAVLRATIDTVKHFSNVSASVGRVCTVLLPPSQSRVRADTFGSIPYGHDTSGVYNYEIMPDDLQNLFED